MFKAEIHTWGKSAPEPIQCQGPEGEGSTAMALTFEKRPIKPSNLSLEGSLEVEIDTCLQICKVLSHGSGSIDTSFSNLILILKHF